MRLVFVAAALILLPALASAQVTTPQSVQNVVQTLRSTHTCAAVSVSSAVAAGGQATQVVASTMTLWSSITIQNLDTAVNLHCGDSVNVATRSANGVTNPLTGFMLAPGSPGGVAGFLLPPGALWYCVNDSGSRAATAEICKGH